MGNEGPSTIDMADEKRRRQIGKLKAALASLDALASRVDRLAAIEDRAHLRNRQGTRSNAGPMGLLVDPKGLTDEELAERIEARNAELEHAPKCSLKSAANGVCGGLRDGV